MTIQTILNRIVALEIAPNQIFELVDISEFKGNPPFLFHNEIEMEPDENTVCEGHVCLCEMGIKDTCKILRSDRQLYNFIHDLIEPYIDNSDENHNEEYLVCSFCILHEVGHWYDHYYRQDKKPYNNIKEQKAMQNKLVTEHNANSVKMSRNYKFEKFADAFALEHIKILIT